MMRGGKAQPRKRMVYGGTTMSAPLNQPTSMGMGMEQDKRNKTRQTMMGMRRGGRASGRNR